VHHTKKDREIVILLADDDPDDVLLTKDAIEESKLSCVIKVVEDGEEALDYLHNRKDFQGEAVYNPKPDLILLDLNMPRMDGREVLRHLKTDDKLKSIPVVVLTTSKQHEDIVETYNLGSNSFITKPIKYEELVKTMKMIGEYWFKTVELPAA